MILDILQQGLLVMYVVSKEVGKKVKKTILLRIKTWLLRDEGSIILLVTILRSNLSLY